MKQPDIKVPADTFGTRIKRPSAIASSAERKVVQAKIQSVKDLYATKATPGGRISEKQELYIWERVMSGHEINLANVVALKPTKGAYDALGIPDPRKKKQPTETEIRRGRGR